jgi:hypothetical protein
MMIYDKISVVNGEAPAVVTHPEARPTRRHLMDTTESSATPAHPSTEGHSHQDERPHACLEGWVFISYVDEHGEEREASYRCRRCADSR